MDLFEYQAEKNGVVEKPLAERMRPRSLAHFAGQEHAVGKGTLIRNAIENDRPFSMVLWGPPGCGKTTLAGIFANETRSHFVRFSAVMSGVKDIRAVIGEARNQRNLYQKRTVLFVDEIHRFNKAQQDAFLHHVESGLITLIGATTENPSFEVIAPLLSRCRVITLETLSEDNIGMLIDRALSEDGDMADAGLELESDARTHLIRIARGDARAALNGLEIAASLAVSGDGKRITLEDLEKALQNKALVYDKSGEEHYNIISAFHKSMRGSDPDAALYWLARMLSAGEDALYIARRMVRFASEDVGNADTNALAVALNAMESFRFLGHPEGELALAQAAVYLATAPKSNSIYTAYGAAKEEVRRSGALPVPFHIRNAPTKLMKDLGYGKGYKYAHDYRDAVVSQEHMPEQLKDKLFYFPSDRGYEKTIKSRLEKWREMTKGIKQGSQKGSGNL